MNIKLILLLGLGFFILNSCDKDNRLNILKPGENNSEHPTLWQYNYGQSQELSNTIPAMDKQGNVFFSIQSGERTKTVYAFGISKNGKALWNKEYTGEKYCDISYLVYQGGKIFFFITRADNLFNETETIICLDAVSGTELWSFTPTYETSYPITAIAATSEYVLIAAEWGSTSADTKELHYFNHSGNLLKSVEIDGHINIELMSVVGQDLFLGLLNFSIDPAKLSIIKMNLATNSINWEFTPDEDYSSAYFAQRSLAVDGNNRVFFIYRSAIGAAPHNLYIINNDGSLNQIISGYPDNHEYFDIIIDKDNSFYTAIDNFAKYASDGGLVWKFYHENSLPSAAIFRIGCILGDNGYVYHAEDDGITNVNTSGELAWAKYHNSPFKDPSYPLLSADGNVIVVGDKYVTCIKGDGAIIEGAWPRVYCNNGNTSSR